MNVINKLPQACDDRKRDVGWHRRTRVTDALAYPLNGISANGEPDSEAVVTGSGTHLAQAPDTPSWRDG